ncbi:MULTISPECIES: hypothetical protein [unclassified Meiothermus]|uniref:hypothetical protein n=1 Tax=unclassified Meiothermus TaxID=370471 RepID=UPI001020C6F8|nr:MULTISPECIES: hypothetical protein [unclassified Meiothermus]RYM36311.1 hypothetical protein EWH23_10310 [Meiothermus sp. PNK-Is4]
MKKWLMLGAVVTALALVGCNNFRWETSIPTVELGISRSDLTSNTVTDTTTGQQTTTYALNLTIDAYTLPGSPGGTVVAINLVGGDQLPAGIAIAEACPTSSTKNCGPYSLSTTINFGTTPPQRGSIKIESFLVKGLTGNSRTIILPEPQPVY